MEIRQIFTFAFAISIILSVASCIPVVPDTGEQPEQEMENSKEEDGKDENEKLLRMKMAVGTYSFDIEYADNNTAEAFKKMLPVTLKMEELNGNEKYCYIDKSLPTASSNLGTIHAGDIMLYGSNCVVVFYETFSTPYSYTRIGKVKDITDLKKALGSGNIDVSFE